MENFNKLYDYLKKENITGEFIKYLKEINIRVNTIVSERWDNKPYLMFNDVCGEWFLFLSNKETRNIKSLMKKAKKRIKLEIPNARCKFVLKNYTYYVKGSC